MNRCGSEAERSLVTSARPTTCQISSAITVPAAARPAKWLAGCSINPWIMPPPPPPAPAGRIHLGLQLRCRSCGRKPRAKAGLGGRMDVRWPSMSSPLQEQALPNPSPHVTPIWPRLPKRVAPSPCRRRRSGQRAGEPAGLCEVGGGCRRLQGACFCAPTLIVGCL